MIIVKIYFGDTKYYQYSNYISTKCSSLSLDIYTNCILKNTSMIYLVKNKRSTKNDSYRAAKLFNLLAEQNLFTTFDNCTVNHISNLYHKLKDSYILNNRQLVKHVCSVRVNSLISFTCMLQHYQIMPGFFRRKKKL